MPDLSGLVVVVTGAGQGVGASVAESLAADGASVVASDLTVEAASRTAAAIDEAGGSSIAVAADVADEEAVAELGARAVEAYGGIDAWISNAGITRPAMLHKMSADDFDAVMAVHARGTFLGIREAARRMIESGRGGSIVNVTSSAGLQGTIGQINYAAAKAAIVGMTKSAAKELARHEIRVNAVAPLAATPMTEGIRKDEKLARTYLANIPMRRFAQPDEVASAFAYLVSADAAFVTGQVVCIDGGLYMAS